MFQLVASLLVSLHSSLLTFNTLEPKLALRFISRFGFLATVDVRPSSSSSASSTACERGDKGPKDGSVGELNFVKESISGIRSSGNLDGDGRSGRGESDLFSRAVKESRLRRLFRLLALLFMTLSIFASACDERSESQTKGRS
jgi:hypothetical protein